jgi:hypothetical protein
MDFAPLPYLDPGSGSFIIQILIAGLLGIGLAVRTSWSRLKRLFGIQPKRKDEDRPDDGRA